MLPPDHTQNALAEGLPVPTKHPHRPVTRASTPSSPLPVTRTPATPKAQRIRSGRGYFDEASHLQALATQPRPIRPSGEQAPDASDAPSLSTGLLPTLPHQPAGLDCGSAPGGSHLYPPQHALRRPLAATATDHIHSDLPAGRVYRGQPIQQQGSASAGAGSALLCNQSTGRGPPIQQHLTTRAGAESAHWEASGGQHQMHASSSHSPPDSAAPSTNASSLPRPLHQDMSQRPELVVGASFNHLTQPFQHLQFHPHLSQPGPCQEPSLDISEGMAGLAVVAAGSTQQEMQPDDVSQPPTYILHPEVGTLLHFVEVDKSFLAFGLWSIFAQACAQA